MVLHISGMDCANCAGSITNALKKKGLEDIQVNFATGEAWYTPKSDLPYAEIKSSIEGLGYKVVDSQTAEKEFFSVEKRLFVCTVFTVPLLLHMVPALTLLQSPMVQLVLCVPVFLIGVLQFGKSAFNSVRMLYPNMDVLIFIGFFSAFIYSLIGTFFSEHNAHQYLFYETTASIITLVILGNYIEKKAVKKPLPPLKSFPKLSLRKQS
jgi:Cu+-exporting ATPase